MDEERDPKAAGQTTRVSHTTLAERVKPIASVLSIALACLGIGAAYASIVWSASNSELQALLLKAKDETEKVKSDYAAYVGQNPPKDKGTPDTAAQATKSASIPSPAKNESQVSVRVLPGDTAMVGDELRISLIGTTFETNPSRYKVNAVVISPGREELKVRNAEVGFVTSYSANGNYDIQILAADAFSAKFLVTRRAS